jgi:hypothetical protein
MPPNPSNEALLAELERMKSRLAELEARIAVPPVRRASRKALMLAACVGLVGGVAAAANGACPNGMPFCFAPDSPALASQVNNNFAQLKEWLEQKVGTSGTADVTITGPTTHTAAVRVQTGATSNAATASGKPMFISGVIGDGTAGAGGLEVRHDNLTQGIGIGYNTIYATGSTPDQSVQLKARGAGTINLLSPVTMSGDLSCGSNTWGSGPITVAFQNRAPCTNSITSRCPNGQFVCGLVFNHGCNVNWWEEQFAVECCAL